MAYMLLKNRVNLGKFNLSIIVIGNKVVQRNECQSDLIQICKGTKVVTKIMGRKMSG